jgi:iron complex outermembrane receptor protein
VGGGVAVYLNATKGTAKYTGSDLWVQNAPSDTETLGLTYNLGNWNIGLFSKRVGQMYNDNVNLHQAIPIDPFNITNLFFNYTVRGSSRLSQSRIRLAVNNLTDSHAITAVSAASAKSNAASPGDILTLMSGRSVSVAFTVGVTSRQP